MLLTPNSYLLTSFPPPPLHKHPIILRRVDAEGRLVNHADNDGIAGLQHPQLLQLLDLLKPGGPPGRQFQEKLAAIGVQSHMLVEMGRIGGQERVVPLPRTGWGCG